MTSAIGQRQEGAARGAAPRAPIGSLVAGGVLILVATFLFWEALSAVDEDGISIEGPRLAPIVVSGGLLVLAVAYLIVEALARGRIGRGPAEEPSPIDAIDAIDATGPTDGDESRWPAWTTPVVLVVTLVAYALVLDPLGFVLATFAFFVAAARILGSHRLVRDVAVAAGLALSVYLAFTRLLEIQLPGGVLPL